MTKHQRLLSFVQGADILLLTVKHKYYRTIELFYWRSTFLQERRNDSVNKLKYYLTEKEDNMLLTKHKIFSGVGWGGL